MRWAAMACVLCACFTKPGFDLSLPVDAGEDAANDRPNIAFVTSTAVGIDLLGGISGADTRCQSLALGAGLPANTYVAWLSMSNRSAKMRLLNARGWVRPDGRAFADTVDQLVSGEIYHPLDIDENEVRRSVSVATATTAAGEAHAADCNEYAVDGDEPIAIGISDATASRWTEHLTALCGTLLHYYCFGTDLQHQVMPTVHQGRTAFVSSPWAPGGGLVGADALCMADAFTNGLDGQFVALLATSTTSAASRLTPGEPWVRVDGVQLAPLAADVIAGTLVTSLNVDAAGTYVDGSAWTGIATEGDLDSFGNLSLTCGDWNSGSGNGACGQIERTAPAWYRGTNAGCMEPRRLYCFEQ